MTLPDNIRNPYLTLLPLLGLYFLLASFSISPNLTGDEPRYVKHAEYLTQGFYVNAEDPNFHSPPGYSLIILPFVALDLNINLVRLLNPVFLFFGLIFFFYTLRFFLKEKHAYIATYLLGLYPFTYYWVGFIFTESLAFFLISGFMYFLARGTFLNDRMISKDSLLAGFMLGYLFLTKPAFPYVAIAFTMAGLLGWLVFKWPLGRVALVALLGAYLLATPYLLYTSQFTGKAHSWSTSGGEQLYFRTSPAPHEYGDWFAARRIFYPNAGESSGFPRYVEMERLQENHIDFFSTLPYAESDTNATNIERDKHFMKKAKENLVAHPEAYIKKTIPSFLRIFFNYPFSYKPQSLHTYRYIIPNMFLVVFLVLSIWPLWIGRKKIPIFIWGMLLFSLLFIGEMAMLNGRVRHLVSILPMLFLVLSYLWTQVVHISIRPAFKS